MKFVEPIKQKQKIKDIKSLLSQGNKIRDLLLFELGINSALRLSDLLHIKVGDLFHDDGNVVKSFVVQEKKTSKRHKVTITHNVSMTLEKYKRRYPSVVSAKSHFIFFNSKITPHGVEGIKRVNARKLINNRCERVGLKGSYGGHTLRKTRGYQARKANISLELIQHKLNHTSMTVTKRYLGITDQELEDACMNLDL